MFGRDLLVLVSSALTVHGAIAFAPRDVTQNKRSTATTRSSFSRVYATASPSSPASDEITSKRVEFQLHPSISSIAACDWDACLGPASSPFVEHAWLRCLEESGCASPESGWVPQHLSIKIAGEVVGYVPLYLKSHSMGEFIFDNSWADAAYQNGINYYPKLLVAVPFTPATGQRILLHPTVWESFSPEELTELRVFVKGFLKRLATTNKLSSVHVNFLTDEEATDLAGEMHLPGKATQDETNGGKGIKNQVQKMLSRIGKNNKDDFLRRTSLQYHWKNENKNNDGKPYSSFEEYLECFRSKRRIAIRRERRKVLEDEDIRIDAIVGKNILKYDGLVERMFDIYLSTIDKMYWGRQYLTKEFFQMLGKSDFIDNLCFICARARAVGEELKADDVFAGTFNIIKDGVFYGRYWGCLAGFQVKNLHFEACYWSAIDFCIQQGLQRMEPGAGGGEYKHQRGFDAVLIHSTHYICDPGLRNAVEEFLNYETENNVELTEYLAGRSVVARTA